MPSRHDSQSNEGEACYQGQNEQSHGDHPIWGNLQGHQSSANNNNQNAVKKGPSDCQGVIPVHDSHEVKLSEKHCGVGAADQLLGIWPCRSIVAAVNCQVRTSNITRLVRCKKSYAASDLVGRCQSSHRNSRSKLSKVFLKVAAFSR
jgi:hypothetical protein